MIDSVDFQIAGCFMYRNGCLCFCRTENVWSTISHWDI